jgi:hypothetical protein
MTDTTPQPLAYESAADAGPRAPRPWWVYAVAGVYVLVVGGLALVPVVVQLFDSSSSYVPLIVITLGLVLCEVALLFVPVRVGSRRPVTRRALWIPLLASATLAALLGLGGTLAVAEYAQLPDNVEWLLWAVPAALWFGWTFVFWTMSLGTGPEAVATRLHRWLLAGSVLELLVAVPTHVVVRRRTDCCAGIGTGLGICAGVVVMLLAFGPSVGFLYYRRWKQVRPPTRDEDL